MHNAQDPEGTDDAVSIADDKRRRNTAASGEDLSLVADRPFD